MRQGPCRNSERPHRQQIFRCSRQQGDILETSDRHRTARLASPSARTSARPLPVLKRAESAHERRRARSGRLAAGRSGNVVFTLVRAGLRARSWEFLSLPNCAVEVLVHAWRHGLVMLISNAFAYRLRVQEAVTANAAMPLVAGEDVRTPLGAFRVRKSARPFKGIIFPDVSEFESYMPSHAVVSTG